MNDTALLLGGFFVFVLASMLVAGYFFIGKKETPGVRDLDISPGLVRDEYDEPDPTVQSTLLEAFHALGEMMPSSSENRRSMEKRLSYAGYRGAPATTSFFGVKSACAVTLGLVLGIIAAWHRGDATMTFAAAVCGLGFGFLLPERFLDMYIRARNNRLRRSLPSALDLMVMSLEAGQPIDQAILLASRGLERFSPDLSAEFMQIILEMRASKSRGDAIRTMYERNSEPELRKLCSLLLDSDRFGSSLGPTLRQHGRYMRIRFRQKAQEAARKLTVKMVFPVFFLIFPSILVVTLGPAALQMIKYFHDFAK